MGRIWSWGQGVKAGCVPFVFRYAKHSDEPLKRKTLGVRPSCFPGLISTAYIHPPGTQPAFTPWQNQNSLTNIYSRKVFPIGRGFCFAAERYLRYRHRGVHSRQILSGSQSYRLHLTILESIKRPYLRHLQALTTYLTAWLIV